MNLAKAPKLAILGTRGVPAAHGGFETLAERLSLHLCERGWDVTVYCQNDEGSRFWQDSWNGVTREHVPSSLSGAAGTVLFDLRSTLHAARRPGVALVLGYNTAVLLPLLRASGRPVVVNMDGLEWKREKWSWTARGWLRFNEWVGAVTANALVADHPEIRRHLIELTSAERITTIPYGADAIHEASLVPLDQFSLRPQRYFLVVARLEPENSILDIVRAFAVRPRDAQLVIVGRMDPSSNTYHHEILASANDGVRFLGPIYDRSTLASLRYHCLSYVHGHTVGGTNPSLVEALGAGSATICQDNPFNRWVAGDGASFFGSINDLDVCMSRFVDDPSERAVGREASLDRYVGGLSWPIVLEAYESLLSSWTA